MLETFINFCNNDVPTITSNFREINNYLLYSNYNEKGLLIDAVLKSKDPVKGMNYLLQYQKANKTIFIFVPEFLKMQNTFENTYYHPEGNVFTHTCVVVRKCKPELRWAALYHDVGKIIDPTYTNHVECSLRLFDRDVANYNPDIDIEKNRWIIKNHMNIKNYFNIPEYDKNLLNNHMWLNDLLEFDIANDMINSGKNAKNISSMLNLKEF